MSSTDKETEAQRCWVTSWDHMIVRWQECDINSCLASSYSLYSYVHYFHGKNIWLTEAWNIEDVSREGIKKGVCGFQILITLKDKQKTCSLISLSVSFIYWGLHQISKINMYILNINQNIFRRHIIKEEI